MIGIDFQMIGLLFPHSLLARLCRDDAGDGLKAKKISPCLAVVPRGSGRSFVNSNCHISRLVRLDSQNVVSKSIITKYATTRSLILYYCFCGQSNAK